jgi:hypothetical protein
VVGGELVESYNSTRSRGVRRGQSKRRGIAHGWCSPGREAAAVIQRKSDVPDGGL